MTNKEAIHHADEYRAYSRAIRLVSELKADDLKLKSRIVTYLYDIGHIHWMALSSMPIEQFGLAMNTSRAKGSR